jgi:hypothetical protein
MSDNGFSLDMEISSTGVLKPRNLQQLVDYARVIAKSGLTPASYCDKDPQTNKRTGPPNISAMVIAMQLGAELGFSPIASLQNIASINGRPCLWGDGLMAKIRSHPDCEWIKEDNLEDIAKNQKATCVVKRKGAEPHSATFTLEMANLADLTKKTGPWKQYPYRMLQMRARAFACRDVFADALGGLAVAEEVIGYGPAEDIIKDAKRTSLSPGLHSLRPQNDTQAVPENVVIENTKNELT